MTFFLSFISGAIFALLNLLSWHWLVPRMLENKKTSKILISFIAFGKFLLIGVVLWVIVSKKVADPLAFLIGISLLVALVLAKELFPKG